MSENRGSLSGSGNAMQHRLTAITIAMLVVGLVLSAQEPPPAFEAASIKETTDLPRGPTPFAPDRFTRSNITLANRNARLSDAG